MLTGDLTVFKGFRTVLVGAFVAAAMATGASASVNLLSNGDFEAGDVGFDSAYANPNALLWDPAVYDVEANPQATHPSWASFGDHTTGQGLMMIVNGADVPDVMVWGEAGIGVEANTDYDFSFWMASTYSTAPAALNLEINGAVVSPTWNASSTTGLWQQFSVTWNSGAASVADLKLWNQQTAYSGNDFALDDLSFAKLGLNSGAIPEPASWALMLAGFGAMGGALRQRRRVALAQAGA